MNSKPMAEFAGLAAMSAVKNLMEFMIESGTLSKDGALHVLTKSAEEHEKAAETTTTNANADAAKILRMCLEDIRLMSSEK